MTVKVTPPQLDVNPELVAGCAVHLIFILRERE
jgi:hypothetical protein